MNKQTIENDLRLIVGGKVTTSGFACSFYTSGFVPIPTWVKTFLEGAPFLSLWYPSSYGDESLICI